MCLDLDCGKEKLCSLVRLFGGDIQILKESTSFLKGFNKDLF